MCIAGVFGGQSSGVTEITKNIFLESACFDPVHVRRTSRRHGLKTDASFRFERGTDPNITTDALQRAARLILETGGGKLSSDAIDVYPKPVSPAVVDLSYSGCAALIGKDVGHDTIKSILQKLSIRILKESGDTLQVEVPPFRVDVRRACDVVEEILRIYGYNNVEDPEFMRIAVSKTEHPDKESLQVKVASHLAASGFNEIFSNSLTRNEYLEDLKSPNEAQSVLLLNPLSSELNALRQSLLFSGLEAVAYNRNRKQNDLRLFELGKVYARFKPGPGLSSYHEEEHLGLLMTGNEHPDSWYEKNRPVDIFMLKNEVEQVLKRLGLSFSMKERQNNDLFRYGLEVHTGKQLIGSLGAVSPVLLKRADIAVPVFFAQLNWTLMLLALKGSSELIYKEVPVYPEVQRDLALLLDRKIRFAELEKLAFETERVLLREVCLFDVFEGEKTGKDKKSLALRFVLQDPSATLTDKQVEKVMEKLMNVYREKMGAEIRS